MLRQWARQTYFALNRCLSAVERGIAYRCGAHTTARPIFIIGAPRSGSTLLCQSLITCFDVAYLSNLHCFFFGAPALAEGMLAPFRWQRLNDYRSSYGRTKGLMGPSECSRYWYRFFPRTPQYLSVEDCTPEQLARCSMSVRLLLRACGRHLLFKNLVCGMRLQPLATAFPEALFLVIKRSIIDNGESILAARNDIYGDSSHWFSIEPPGIAKLRTLPAHEQAIEQIRAIHGVIEEDEALIGADRFMSISYEQLCKNPMCAMDLVVEFFGRHGVELRYSGWTCDPFTTRSNVRIEQSIYDQMCAYVRRTQKDDDNAYI